MERTYVTLETGFLALTSTSLRSTRPLEVERTGISGDALRRVDRQVVFNHSSKAVDTLFERMRTEDNVLSNMEYFEEVLIEFKTLFGSSQSSFYDWCLAQVNCRSISPAHVRFLSQTFDFLSTGRRLTNPMLWVGTLEAKKAGERSGDYETILRNTFLHPTVGRRVPKLTDEILYEWLSKDAGLADLVTTMKVIFGTLSLLSVKQ